MNADNREERIRQMAHRIWESEGRPQGQEARHWHMAERLVEASEREPEDGERPRDEPPKE
jgi:hypothetical protein